MTATVLITGASSGIGLSTAIAAARAGLTPIATMRDLDRHPGRGDELRRAAADAGVSVEIRQLDVTDPESIEACVAGVIAAHGRLDALVNNAGVGNTVPTIEVCDLAAYRANIEVNFFGVVAMTRAALPHLRASRGRVITIGSTRGLIGQPFNEAYSAAKFAVEGFMESLAPVAAGVGVTVTMIEPGPVFSTAFAANTGVTREMLLASAGPYEGVLRPYLDWVARGAWPGAQTAAEVADVVLRTLADPQPPFRVLTSDWARQYAARKLVDPEGTELLALTRSWVSGLEG